MNEGIRDDEEVKNEERRDGDEAETVAEREEEDEEEGEGVLLTQAPYILATQEDASTQHNFEEMANNDTHKEGKATNNNNISIRTRIPNKKLWTRNEEGEKINLLACPSPTKEIEYVTGLIQHLNATKKFEFGEMAVLFRNYKSRKSFHMTSFEKRLKQRGIPFILNGKDKFFKRGSVLDILSHLKLIINPDDNDAFMRVLALHLPLHSSSSPSIEGTSGNQSPSTELNRSTSSSGPSISFREILTKLRGIEETQHKTLFNASLEYLGIGEGMVNEKSPRRRLTHADGKLKKMIGLINKIRFEAAREKLARRRLCKKKGWPVGAEQKTFGQLIGSVISSSNYLGGIADESDEGAIVGEWNGEEENSSGDMAEVSMRTMKKLQHVQRLQREAEEFEKRFMKKCYGESLLRSERDSVSSSSSESPDPSKDEEENEEGEGGGGLSMLDMLTEFVKEIESGGKQHTGLFSDRKDAVTLSTIHKAKGLEVHPPPPQNIYSKNPNFLWTSGRRYS